MTLRPLYRWKSFWLGVLVLGLLGWAWVRSMGHDEGVSFGLGVDQWRIGSTLGKISAWRFSNFVAGQGIHSVYFSSEAGGGYMREFPPAFEHFVFEGPPRAELWIVADWLILLAFLVAWVSFLAWKWWRQRIPTKCP
jgi:hypothetical protein